jgi:hypothetical protein
MQIAKLSIIIEKCFTDTDTPACPASAVAASRRQAKRLDND